MFQLGPDNRELEIIARCHVALIKRSHFLALQGRDYLELEIILSCHVTMLLRSHWPGPRTRWGSVEGYYDQLNMSVLYFVTSFHPRDVFFESREYIIV